MFSQQCGANLHTYGPTLAQTCSGSIYLVFMSLLDDFLRDTCEISDASGRITPRTYPGNIDWKLLIR